MLSCPSSLEGGLTISIGQSETSILPTSTKLEPLENGVDADRVVVRD